MKKISKVKLKRNDAIAAGLLSLNDAGYRTPMRNKDGDLNENAVSKVDSLLDLPRIQNAMALKFEAAGFAVEDANELLINLMKAGDKNVLASLKLFYELTGNLNAKPLVQVNNNTLNAGIAPNKVYDHTTWTQEPKLVLDKSLDKSLDKKKDEE